MVLNGMMYLFAMYPYLYALQQDNASSIVPLSQMIPVFTFILGYVFLKETLLATQIIGGVMILISSVFVSLNIFDLKNIKIRWKTFGLMVLSCLLYSIHFVVFKKLAIETDFWTTNFWEYIGVAIFGSSLFLLSSNHRDRFLNLFKARRKNIIVMNFVNEALNIMAKLSFNFAIMLAPVALVWIIDSLQPFFVFIFGIALAFFLPKIFKEDFSRNAIIQKILAIVIMFIGVYLVNMR